MPHPDEGLIHSWLDGELDAVEAARVEALVRDDPEWTAAAAAARGFVAASARIAEMLDDVPANVIPIRPLAQRAMPWWVKGVAALLVVAVSGVVARQRGLLGDALTILPESSSAPSPAVVPPHVAPPAAAAKPVESVTVAPVEKVARDQPTVSAAAPTNTAAAAGAAPASPPPAAELRELKDLRQVPPTVLNSAGRVSAAGAAAKVAQPVECFRERAPGGGAEAVVHVVRRTGDSVAVNVDSTNAVMSKEADRSKKFAAQSVPPMLVRGDTLFVGAANGVARPALRVHCPE